MTVLRPLVELVEPGLDEPLPLSLVLDRRKPVSDQIYVALKDAIVTLRLPPGTSISENRICRHIGVSRTPVREAIIRLTEDELIDVFPQQGSFVSAIRVSKIRESHFIRKCLELGVLEKAVEHWSSQHAKEAERHLREQDLAVESGDRGLAPVPARTAAPRAPGHTRGLRQPGAGTTLWHYRQRVAHPAGGDRRRSRRAPR